MNYYDITIKKVNNGFVVTAGCVTLVFKTEKEMFAEMKAYWKDPEKVRKKYNDNSLMSTFDSAIELAKDIMDEAVHGKD
jgi:acyl-coenzyme A synthetase/AMP-(fatty) acid ligase